MRAFPLLTVLLLCISASLLSGCGPSRVTDTPIPPMTEVNAYVELISVEVGGLTPDQRGKVREIIVDNAAMKQRIYAQYRGRPRELEDAEKNRLKKLDRQIQGVLTAEQIEPWKPLFRAIYAEETDPVTRQAPQHQRQQDNPYGGPGF